MKHLRKFNEDVEDVEEDDTYSDHHKALFNFLQGESEIEEGQIGDMTDNTWRGNDMKTFGIPNGKEYRIGVEEVVAEEWREYWVSLIDDMGIPKSEYRNHMVGVEVADYYMEGEEENIRDNPDGHDIKVRMTEEDIEKLEQYEAMMNESDEEMSDTGDKLDIMRQKLDKLRQRFFKEKDQTKSSELDDKIQKLNKVIYRLSDKYDIAEEQFNIMEELVDDYQDENGRYWDIQEEDVQEAVDKKRKEIEDDPVDWLDQMGMFEEPDNSYMDSNSRKWEKQRKETLEGFVDKDAYIESLIDEEDRGRLSGYDSVEHEIHYNGTWYYIYRDN